MRTVQYIGVGIIAVALTAETVARLFKEMRESGAVARLDAEADAVINGDRRRRNRVIFRQDDLKAVVELVVFDRRFEAGGVTRRRQRNGDRRRGESRAQSLEK